MKYKVLREHVGDKHYKAGEERELDARDAGTLIANGVLEDPNNPKVPDGHIPDDWKSLKADAMKALATSLGGKDIQTKSDAEAFIQNKLNETEEPVFEAQVDEREGKFVIVKGDDVIGEPYDTKEAAEAALDALAIE